MRFGFITPAYFRAIRARMLLNHRFFDDLPLRLDRSKLTFRVFGRPTTATETD